MKTIDKLRTRFTANAQDFDSIIVEMYMCIEDYETKINNLTAGLNDCITHVLDRDEREKYRQIRIKNEL